MHLQLLLQISCFFLFVCSSISLHCTHTMYINFKGAGSFHIHRKTMKDLWILAVLGVQEQPNLAYDLVTHRH